MNKILSLVLVLFLQASSSGAGEIAEIPTRSEAAAIVAAEMLAEKQQEESRRSGLESVEALEEWEINRGGKKIILRRVAAPLPGQGAGVSTVQPEWTKEQFAQWLALHPERRMIHLNARVYDRSATELIWRGADGREWRIFSNVDFNYLNGIGSFSDGSYVWSTVVLLENIDSAGEQARVLLAAANGVDYTPRTAPDAGLFSSVAPEYLVYAESEESVPHALYEELDALHQYYRANREQLVAEYERRQVLSEARLEWQKHNPPEPKDTVINFWRVE